MTRARLTRQVSACCLPLKVRGCAVQVILNNMLIIGHRGASGAAEENTVQAFVLADAMGADGVELDVRLAPDGRLIVKHDPLPDSDQSFEGLSELAEILTACGDMLVNVEIKNLANEAGYDPEAAVVEPTIAEMRRHGAVDRWIISSFDWATIQRCREVAPDIMTAYLVRASSPEVIEQTAAAGHVALHPWEPVVDEQLVQDCHAAGLAVNTYTCNDPDRLRNLVEIGVDGVCTDFPDVALTAIGRRLGPSTPRWETLN